jgi:hypothetical protein
MNLAAPETDTGASHGAVWHPAVRPPSLRDPQGGR